MNARYKESPAPLKSVREIRFGILGSDEIQSNSVVEITTPEVFEKGLPKVGGLYDLRMGTIDKRLLCQTCNGDVIDCQGHFGHMILS